MKNCKFYLYTPLTQKLKRSSFLQSRINSLHTLFMACLLSFLKSAIVLKSGANFWVATLALYFFYTPFLNTDWSEYHLSSHKYIQLVEKLRCILSLPNLFSNLARCSWKIKVGEKEKYFIPSNQLYFLKSRLRSAIKTGESHPERAWSWWLNGVIC